MAETNKPLTLEGEPLFFDGLHNAWFENHHALASGSVANAYRQHFASSAPFILSDLLPTTLKRSNAKKVKHPNAGKMGTAGISGVSRKPHVKESHPGTFGTAGVSGVRRSNAVREKHPNAGGFGTAGVSGLHRTDGQKKERLGKNTQRREVDDMVMQGTMGSYLDSEGSRRSSRVARSSSSSPTSDLYADPPM
ncbi:uncharacterized protein RCC_02805 [Ramularia collo-cygni]|uniref:Uncharacterized protein n=1 Tax=Ramularia collo-cygni TaxID=112498 RepID=A0A2D3V986_9PEZI|nr:uncharacterized protein RCC_02805 [Ramularia collo-cygni]CZT16973.1 uncharacterized protein RCC_02805 [Ramularia collo-cygni]